MMLRCLLALLLCLGLSAQAEEFLDPLVAFKPTAKALDGETAEVRFAIAKGYYLYRDKFRFKAEPESITLGQAQYLAGKMKKDDLFGEVEVYYKEAVIRVPVERNSSGTLPLTLKLTSQGCADGGICYPPQVQTVSLTLPDPATTPSAKPMAAQMTVGSGDESGQIAQLLKDASFWVVVVSFFGFGLLLSLTPCVFPDDPDSLRHHRRRRGKNSHKVSHSRAFMLSLAYVLGMAMTYAAAGIAAGMTGTLLSAALQNAWVLGAFALVFVVLSLSMFGFYELQLPTFLQSKPVRQAGHLKGGSLPGVTAMGALVGADRRPLRRRAAGRRPALHRADRRRRARRHRAVRHGAGHGRAAAAGRRLLALAAAARVGPWMEGVKKGLRRDPAGTALWMVSPVIPVPDRCWPGRCC
jgi:thiol:disulfide interchange protein DsbD